MPPLHFDQPLVLALLAPLPALLALAWPRLRRLPVAQVRWVLGLRGAMLALLVAALAGPSLGLRSQALSVVFALDVSDSMTAEQQAWARQWVQAAIQALGPEDRWSTIAFGERPALVADPARSPGLPTDGTDLEAALQLARSLLPATGAREVVLLTDGWDSADRVAPGGLPSGGPRVSYVLPGPPGIAPEVALRALEVEPAVRV